MQIVHSGGVTKFSPMEASIITVLSRRHNQDEGPISCRALAGEVGTTEKSIRVVCARIRSKLRPLGYSDPIPSAPHEGYRWNGFIVPLPTEG